MREEIGQSSSHVLYIDPRVRQIPILNGNVIDPRRVATLVPLNAPVSQQDIWLAYNDVVQVTEHFALFAVGVQLVVDILNVVILSITQLFFL